MVIRDFLSQNGLFTACHGRIQKKPWASFHVIIMCWQSICPCLARSHFKDDSQNELTLIFFLWALGRILNGGQFFFFFLTSRSFRDSSESPQGGTPAQHEKGMMSQGASSQPLLMAWFSTYKQENAMETFVFLFEGRRREGDGGGTKPPSAVCFSLPIATSGHCTSCIVRIQHFLILATAPF